MMWKPKKHPKMTGKLAQELREIDLGLSEKELGEVTGGFNPQPDPPCILLEQARLTPGDFGIRPRQIGG
jgi:hypothetical protein